VNLFAGRLFAGRLFAPKLFRGAVTVQPERPGDAAQAPTGGSASLSQSEFLKLNQLQTSAPPVVDKALVARRKRQRLEDDMLAVAVL
jgi:hypothetical protein